MHKADLSYMQHQVASSTPEAGRQPCDRCVHYFTRLASPDGSRQQRACRLYRYAANRCADYAEAK